MQLTWTKANGERLMEASGAYSEWRIMVSTCAEDNGHAEVYVLVRIMLNDKDERVGVQVGEFYDIECGFSVAQLVEDGKVVDYSGENPNIGKRL